MTTTVVGLVVLVCVCSCGWSKKLSIGQIINNIIRFQFKKQFTFSLWSLNTIKFLRRHDLRWYCCSKIGPKEKVKNTVFRYSFWLLLNKFSFSFRAEKLAAAFPQGAKCQKCLEYGHWSYECTGKRKFVHRDSRTKTLNKNITEMKEKKNPKNVKLEPPAKKSKQSSSSGSDDSDSSSDDSDSDSSDSDSDSSDSSDDSSSSSSSSKSSSNSDSESSSDSNWNCILLCVVKERVKLIYEITWA